MNAHRLSLERRYKSASSHLFHQEKPLHKVEFFEFPPLWSVLGLQERHPHVCSALKLPFPFSLIECRCSAFIQQNVVFSIVKLLCGICPAASTSRTGSDYDGTFPDMDVDVIIQFCFFNHRLRQPYTA